MSHRIVLEISDRALVGMAAMGAVWVLTQPVQVQASAVSGLNTFVNGEFTDANEVNHNFNLLKAAVDDNHQRISALENSVGNGTGVNPGTSCAAILESSPGAADGTYWIDPDGGSTANAFQAYCDMTSHGGGWTLVLSAGLGYDLTLGDNTGSFGAPTSGQPADNTLAKLSDAEINLVRTHADDSIAYWVTTPGDGVGLHGAEIFHRADCVFGMGQTDAQVKATTCNQSTTQFSDTPAWVGGGRWWDNTSSYNWAFGYANEGDHGTGNLCHTDGTGLGAHGGGFAPFHRGWCSNQAWGQVWVR